MTTRTDEQIIAETNDLARYLLAELVGTGYQVPDDHKFYEAEDPRSQKAWQHAVKIMEMTTKTEMADALMALNIPLPPEDEEAEQEPEPVEREYGVRIWATFRTVAETTVTATSFKDAVKKAEELRLTGPVLDFSFSIPEGNDPEGDETVHVFGPDDADLYTEDPWEGEGVEVDRRADGEPFSWDACAITKDLAKLYCQGWESVTILSLISRAHRACEKITGGQEG